MPRQARKKCESRIYHVMLRGINHQQIFEDKEDNLRFLDTLARYKKACEYEIYAYCLMGNHIHILLKEGKESLSQTLKRIAGSYVYWYNWKYSRVGHLFQDRFKSEPVEDETYLLTVLRYIHQNPVKAGLCKNVEGYKFSSYNEYVNKPNIIDAKFCFSIIDKEQFVEFNNQLNEDVCLELFDKNYRLTDDKAKETIRKISRCKNLTEFQSLDINKRDKFIKELKEKGLSIRQICRLTGVSFSVVRKL